MCEVDNKLNVSWQLVSQFVSWDFCRYMCEQSENQSSETDVLTFLRNMIVARTEKRATDITKHEIVAKFIMETRTIRSKSRMPCIIALSETVKRICPELKSSIEKLLHHLENLLNVLDWNEDSQKDEIILSRIEQSVNDFTIEACKLLPLPDLLQVVSSWINPELQVQVWKARQKNVANAELYQRVVNCLREEIITPIEAKTIALALYEDKALEKIINSETEVEADSQQNSPIVSSQQNSPFVSSQQNTPLNISKRNVPSGRSQPRSTNSEKSLQLSSQHEKPVQEKQLDSDGLFTFDPIFPQSQQSLGQQNQLFQGTQDSLEPSSQQSLAPSEQYRLTEGIQNLGSLNPIESYLFKPTCPEPLFRTLPPKPAKSNFPQADSDVSDFSPKKKSARNTNNKSLSSPEPEFYTAPIEPSEDHYPLVDSDSSDFSPEKISATNKHRKKFARQIDSDLDLSDNDDGVVMNVPKVISYKEKSFNAQMSNFYVGNNSGSDTSDCDKDPEFRFLTPTMFKSGQLQQNPPASNAVVWLSDDETHGSSVHTDPPSSQHIDDPSFRGHHRVSTVRLSQSPPLTREKKKAVVMKRAKKKQLQSSKDTKAPRQTTLRGFGFSSDTSNQNEVAKEKVPEKKRFKLFDNDMIPKQANESALFQKNNAKKKQKTNQKIEDLGLKRRCVECKKTFRTALDLKKHVFIVHTTEDLNSTEEFI